MSHDDERIHIGMDIGRANEEAVAWRETIDGRIEIITVSAAPIHPDLIARYEREIASLEPWQREIVEKVNAALERKILGLS